MEHPRPLPVREPPLPGESLAGLLCRTAAAMGYDNHHRITRLLGEAGEPHPGLNRMQPGPPLERLAALLRLSPDHLLRMTVHRLAPALVLRPAGSPPATLCDHKTALRYFEARVAPVCPGCMAGPGPPYERLVWGFRPLRVCTRHGLCLLSRCPVCGRLLLAGRHDPARCQCGAALAGTDPARVPPTAAACARALEEWLGQGFPAVPDLSAAAGFWWCDRLAAAVDKTPVWARRAADRFGIDPDTAPELLRWTGAVELLTPWPDHFHRFLDEFQKVAKAPARSTGVERSFGSLLRDAARLEGLGYPAPAEALRTYLVQRYTAGHVNRKVALFRGAAQALLGDRPWYTQTEAADVLRLRPTAVTELVRRGIVKGQVQAAGDRSMGVVSRGSVEALRQALDTGLHVPEVGERLGLGRAQVLELIRTGALADAVRTREGWTVPVEAVHALEGWLQRLPPLDAERRLWLPLRQATRVYGAAGLNLVRVLAMARAGQVAARTDPQHRGLRGLWLSERDVRARLPALRAGGYREHGYPLCRLAKVLLPNRPCRELVLKKLIRAGVLRAHREGRAWLVAHEEVERFRAEYCLADEACSLLRIGRTTLSHWESQGRVRPVYGKRTCPGAGFSLYRKADLLRLCQDAAATAAGGEG
jgi:hypothetical protein